MERSSIRTPDDFISLMGHSLGYWPEEGLVCVTLDDHRIGATLRFIWLLVEAGQIEKLGEIMKLHHVQVSMPKGEEGWTRLFYGEALGLTEVEKPSSLAGRGGGCWFRAFEGTSVVAEIHLGGESGFGPAQKAHPGLSVASRTELEDLATRKQSAGFDLSWEERHTFEGYERFHCRDPCGNRVEVLSPLTL